MNPIRKKKETEGGRMRRKKKETETSLPPDGRPHLRITSLCRTSLKIKKLQAIAALQKMTANPENEKLQTITALQSKTANPADRPKE